MTYSNVIATGNGSLSFRLEIAGHPIEFVTSDHLAGNSSDGRVRMAGLNASTIKWSEHLDPAACKLTQQGFTAEIIDDSDGIIGNSFSLEPDITTYLEGSITPYSTFMDITAPVLTDGTYVYMGQECIGVYLGTGDTHIEITRGRRGSQIQSHYVDPPEMMVRPEITNRRPSIEGLTAYVYAYGDGETGDGTLVWTGIVEMQPRLRSLNTWEISIGGVMNILDQTLSKDLTIPFSIRGINFHVETTPRIHLWRHQNHEQSSARHSSDHAIVVVPAGFYETQEDFCDAVNTAIVAYTAGWSEPLTTTAPSLKAVPKENGSWTLLYTTGAHPHDYWLEATCVGYLEPFISSANFMRDEAGDLVETVGPNHIYSLQHSDIADDMSRTSLRTAIMPNAGMVPRGMLGRPLSADMRRDPPLNTLYLGGTTELTTGDTIILKWPAFNGLPEATHSWPVLNFDTTDRFATVAFSDRGLRTYNRAYIKDYLPELTISRLYSSATEGVNVAAFIANLCSNAPVEAPAGRQPFITTQHIDTTTTTANVDIITAGIPWINNRYYGGFKDANLAEFITEECKMAGLVPSIATDGRYKLIPFQMAAPTEATVFTIDSSNHLTQRQLPGFEHGPYGIVNRILMSTGYDLETDKYLGSSIIARDCIALSRNPLPRDMTIKPKSYAVTGDAAIDVQNDIVRMAQTWFSVLGGSYNTVTLTLPLTAINCIIGERVGITVSQIPDTENGGRGIVDLPGIVLGRSVNPLEGYVELTVLMSQARIAGYAPSSVVSVSNVGMGLYECSIIVIEGWAAIEEWVVGDKVIILELNVDTPRYFTGDIVSINPGGSMVIGGSGDDPTTFSVASVEYQISPYQTVSQQKFCTIADTTDLVLLGATFVPARTFA